MLKIKIIKSIIDKIGEIDRKIDAQAKDKYIFHKNLVGLKVIENNKKR